jgi:formylglycine-generating enzyme required for sulfatase activity
MRNITKNRIVFFAIMLLCCTFCEMTAAQSISRLIARYIDCQVVVKFNLTVADSAGTQLTLVYSGDNGITWLPCITVSGDTGIQTSGDKTIVWDCKADGVGYGVVEFRVDYPTGCDERYTVTGNGKTVSFIMKCVKGGILYIGNSSNPLSESANVTLSDFSIGEYEVTQALWFAVMGSWSHTAPSSMRGEGDNYPVYNVSWNDIVGTGGTTGYTINGVEYKTDGFCYRLSQLVGNGKKFCLPTEAQWEYAARGGQQTHGYGYSGSDVIDDVAWYSGNSSSKTHEVGTKAGNELGLYDMSGNVLEWCSDWSGAPYPSSAIDPVGAVDGPLRMIRGGDFSNAAADCALGFRNMIPPSLVSDGIGFRCVYCP